MNAYYDNLYRENLFNALWKNISNFIKIYQYIIFVVDLLFYIFGLLLSLVSVFFKPPFLKSQMELSSAPRSADFGGGDVFWAGAWEGGGGARGAEAWGGGGADDVLAENN